MNYRETLEKIHALGMFSLPAGLDRIRGILSALGQPQADFPAVHIAGTNGKGSTAAFTAAIFRAAGKKTGLFISPYITDFCERIQIDGKPIPKAELCRLAERVFALCLPMTEFECITAIGFLYFSENRCDIAVIETGLGGRLDATNLLPPPLVSVITKIGLDHTAILGETITQIATEKCGIIKENPVVSTPGQDPAAMAVIRRFSKNLTVPDLSMLSVGKIGIGGNEFYYKNEHYTTRLGGDYQIENALTAIETVRASGLNIPPVAVQKGLAEAHFPARLEVFSGKNTFVLDGAHNPDGAAALEKTLRAYSGRAVAVIGMMRDKDVRQVLRILLPHCRKVIAVTVPGNPRALPAEQLAETAKEFCQNTVRAKDYASALCLARDATGEDPVFIFGSLYLAAGIRPLLQNGK